MPYLSDLYVEMLDKESRDGRQLWRLTEDLIYFSDRYGIFIITRKGYVTDFITLKRYPIAYMLIGETAHRPPVTHDDCYDNQHVDKKMADLIFYDALLEEGVGKIKANAMYWAVRLFGRGTYDQPKAA